MNQLFRIIEAASLLGVSKVTVYKKISALKPDIKKHLVKEKNVTFITSEGIHLINESLKHHSIIHDIEDSTQTLRKGQISEETYIKETERILAAYLGDLVITYDYLKSVLKNKQERLNQMQQTTEVMRQLCRNIREEGNGGNNG